MLESWPEDIHVYQQESWSLLHLTLISLVSKWKFRTVQNVWWPTTGLQLLHGPTRTAVRGHISTHVCSLISFNVSQYVSFLLSYIRCPVNCSPWTQPVIYEWGTCNFSCFSYFVYCVKQPYSVGSLLKNQTYLTTKMQQHHQSPCEQLSSLFKTNMLMGERRTSHNHLLCNSPRVVLTGSQLLRSAVETLACGSLFSSSLVMRWHTVYTDTQPFECINSRSSK